VPTCRPRTRHAGPAPDSDRPARSPAVGRGLGTRGGGPGKLAHYPRSPGRPPGPLPGPRHDGNRAQGTGARYDPRWQSVRGIG